MTAAFFSEELAPTPPEAFASSNTNSNQEPETPPEASLATLKQELEKAQAQAQEYLDRWKRTAAELANYRKRVEDQAAQTRQRIRAEVLAAWLDIVDDLERALNDPNRPQRGKARKWSEGIELIYNKVRHLLEMQGVMEIPAQPGQPFDPYLHEAVGFVEDSPYEEGHIVEVVRKGYQVGDMVIRPALVKVAR